MPDPEEMEGEVKESKTCIKCSNGAPHPVFRCDKGHLICNNCIKELELCPECGDVLPTKKGPRVAKMENLKNTLTLETDEASCPCNQVEYDTAIHHESEDHKFHCEYANLKYCSLMGLDCNKELKKVDLPEHFISNHQGTSFSDYVLGDELTINQDSFQKLEEGEDGAGKYLTLIRTGNHTFILEFSHNEEEKVIKWSVVLLGTEQEAREFTAYIRLIPTSVTPTEGCVSRKWQGLVAGIKLNHVRPAEMKNLFSVHYDRCPLLVFRDEADGKLKWKIVLSICHTAVDEENPLPMPTVPVPTNPEKVELVECEVVRLGPLIILRIIPLVLLTLSIYLSMKDYEW